MSVEKEMKVKGKNKETEEASKGQAQRVPVAKGKCTKNS